jgi:5-methylcytosine-specific restriction endonuclease McrA
MIRKKYGSGNLIKDKCEICGFNKSAALNIHHIIPRCDERSSNNISNLAVVCHSCHDLVHAGEITIIGVYNSTAGRKLMWFKEGEEPPLPKEFWLIKENPMVIRGKRNN